MTFSYVLGRTWELYARFFARFFLLAVLVFAVASAVFAGVAVALDEDVRWQATVILLVSMGASLIGTFWLQGAVVLAVEDARDGTMDTSVADLLRRVRPSLGRLLVAGLVVGVSAAVGFVLILPGLLVLTVWALVAPAIVLEGCGVREALRRSWALVRGHVLVVLSIVVVTTLLGFVASSVLRSLVSFLPQFAEILVGSTLSAAIVAPFSAIALTVMFFALRDGGLAHPAPPD